MRFRVSEHTDDGRKILKSHLELVKIMKSARVTAAMTHLLVKRWVPRAYDARSYKEGARL